MFSTSVPYRAFFTEPSLPSFPHWASFIERSSSNVLRRATPLIRLGPESPPDAVVNCRKRSRNEPRSTSELSYPSYLSYLIRRNRRRAGTVPNWTESEMRPFSVPQSECCWSHAADFILRVLYCEAYIETLTLPFLCCDSHKSYRQATTLNGSPRRVFQLSSARLDARKEELNLRL